MIEHVRRIAIAAAIAAAAVAGLALAAGPAVAGEEFRPRSGG
ncbi:hypothetical protein [Nonomuraea basaltis]|nr:hypothetical protein [Nonomuraea basaltis]